MAAGYCGAGTFVFQKDKNGQISPSAAVLLLPYRLLALISYYWYAKQCRHTSVVNSHIALGGYPQAPLSAAAVPDMTGELPRSLYTLVRQARPQIVLREPTLAALTRWTACYGNKND